MITTNLYLMYKASPYLGSSFWGWLRVNLLPHKGVRNEQHLTFTPPIISCFRPLNQAQWRLKSALLLELEYIDFLLLALVYKTQNIK